MSAIKFSNATEILDRLISGIRETRGCGNTYIPAGIRRSVSRWDAVPTARIGDRNVTISFCGWGRSLESTKGHKYKAHANWADTGKPVPSKLLGGIVA